MLFVSRTANVRRWYLVRRPSKTARHLCPGGSGSADVLFLPVAMRRVLSPAPYLSFDVHILLGGGSVIVPYRSVPLWLARRVSCQNRKLPVDGSEGYRGKQFILRSSFVLGRNRRASAGEQSPSLTFISHYNIAEKSCGFQNSMLIRRSVDVTSHTHNRQG